MFCKQWYPSDFLIYKMKKGFTIVETLVAVSILAVVIAGAMGAVQTGLSSYIYSKDQIIAFYLAQEGFEQIRNLRDENWLKGRAWLYGISDGSSDPCYFGNACIVDPVSTLAPTRCTGVGSCPILRQDSATGFYGYNGGWSATNFRREIVLSSINANEVTVTVTVNWLKGSANRQFRAKGNLMNWR